MSRSKKVVVKGWVAVLLACAVACSGGTLDDGGTANVVLEVQNIPQIPPVTSAFDETSQTCTFTVAPVSVTLQNRPKNSLAITSPFNDILMESVTLRYQWDDEPALHIADRLVTLGGTVTANGSGTVSFPPVFLGDLTTVHAGHSANVGMTFRGRTVDGKVVTATGGGVLSVNSCITTSGP